MTKKHTNNSAVTIKDVAEVAGVSVATVSRVMNQNEIVRDSTRERVIQAMEMLSYSPNMSARCLRKKESRSVLVMTPDLTNPFYAHIIMGISEVAMKLEYSPLIVPFKSEDKAEAVFKELVDSRKTDGAILLNANIDDDLLMNCGRDYVIVQCAEYSKKAEKIPRVSIDNHKAMYDMTKRLQSLGHKRIALVINDNRFVSTSLRVDGFKEAMLEAQPGYDIEKYIFKGLDYSFETGKDALEHLVKMDEAPTAIMCISDIIALGAVRGATDMGLSIPEDISITGFDDVDYTKMFHPYLTTVRQPCYQMGSKSMQLMYDLLNERDAQTEIFLEHEIKIRESTKAI